MAGGSTSSSSSWGPSPALVTAVVALLGLGLAAYIVGPQLYWHASEALGRSTGACPACDCDCDARPLLALPEGPCRCSLSSQILLTCGSSFIQPLPARCSDPISLFLFFLCFPSFL